MAGMYVRSYTVERNFHPSFVEKGYRYGADFKIDFAGEAAYATIILTVLWNADKKLAPGTTRTETTITDAAVAVSKSGIGWAIIADIPGYDAWVSYKNTVIWFRKQFTAELPVAPALAAIPVIGKLAEELEATHTVRIEVEGYIDIISYVEDMRAKVF
jgi:hypothetical protein